NPGTTTLDRLVELAHEVDFAAFAFARDDWTSTSLPASPPTGSGQASPRDNVVFEAGLFGGVLGMRRTFILHANGSKLPRIFSGSRVYATAKQRPLLRSESSTRSFGRRSRTRAASHTSRACGGSSP